MSLRASASDRFWSRRSCTWAMKRACWLWAPWRSISSLSRRRGPLRRRPRGRPPRPAGLGVPPGRSARSSSTSASVSAWVSRIDCLTVASDSESAVSVSSELSVGGFMNASTTTSSLWPSSSAIFVSVSSTDSRTDPRLASISRRAARALSSWPNCSSTFSVSESSVSSTSVLVGRNRVGVDRQLAAPPGVVDLVAAPLPGGASWAPAGGGGWARDASDAAITRAVTTRRRAAMERRVVVNVLLGGDVGGSVVPPLSGSGPGNGYPAVMRHGTVIATILPTGCALLHAAAPIPEAGGRGPNWRPWPRSSCPSRAASPS